MMTRPLVLALSATALLAGCVYIPLGHVPQLTAGTLAAAGKATLNVRPLVADGGYTTQALVTPYAKADVNHVLVTLFKVDGASEVAMVDPTGTPLVKDVLQANLDTALTFGNLHPNTTYRLRAVAFSATGTASADVISLEASMDVHVLTDDKPTAADFPVTLRDRSFQGEATSSFEFVPGGFATIPESIP